jgi:two-component system, NarL family, sensor kinase
MSLFHDADRARRLGLFLAAISAAAAVTGMAFFVAGGGRFTESWMPQNLVGSLTLAGAFAAMVHRQPNNGAVWTLGGAMVFQAFGQVLISGVGEFGRAQVLDSAHLGAETLYTYGQLPAWLAWLSASPSVTWIPGVVPLVTLALLLFPDGRLPSRRWRPAFVLAAVAIAWFATAIAMGMRPRPDLVVGEMHQTPAQEAALGVGVLLMLGAFLASIAALVTRYRRSSGIERRQIRWIAAGGGLFGLSLCVWITAIIDFDLAQRIWWGATLITLPAYMAAYAVAILRYRLYDIDVVISRSLVLASLAGFIAAVYVAVVVGVGRLVGADDEASLLLQIIATAIVAVAFQPIRRRVRRWADALVYGQRATPYEVLAQFSRTAANAGDEASLQRIADVLAAGTGAQPAIVWLRVGDHVRAAAASDRSEPPAPAALRDGDLPDLDAAVVVPVRHDGELLGAISLEKSRTEPPTPQDSELAVRLASGLGLLLRNVRLTAELRERLDDLEASRHRIVHAQDETRRKIERDLRDGAEQQLVELKAVLGLTLTKAAEHGAGRIATLLEQLVAETDDAVDALRDLAGGVYPPVLEAEGLGPALSVQVGKSMLPVTLHASGLGRYGREIEATVYFCVLEALQNATKYAKATSAHVRLEERDGLLRFEVSDDGVGFDPSENDRGSGLRGMADRLDTVGGSMEVRSTPGTGTRVVGVAPVARTARRTSTEVLA